MSICKHDHDVTDVHSGDRICSDCGFILSERLILENSLTYSYCFEENTIVNRCGDTSKTIVRAMKSNNPMMHQHVLTKCVTLLNQHIMNFSLRVIDKVTSVLSEFISSGAYYNIGGTNRRGVIAVCLYIACKSCSQQCSMNALLSSFNIKLKHFYHARRFLYDWNQKTPICSWFFEQNQL